MSDVYGFAILLVIAVLAFITPIIGRRLNIPLVVGEILLGIFVGFIGYVVLKLYGFELFPDDIVKGSDSPIGFLATMGFVVLMFLTGLEINFDYFEILGRKPIYLGLAMIGMTIAINVGVVAAMRMFWDVPWLLTLGVSTTSTAVVMLTIREMGMVRSPRGQKIIIYTFIIDIVVLILIPVFYMMDQGSHSDVERLGRLLFIPVLFVVFFVVGQLGTLLIWKYPETMAEMFKGDDASEIGVRASLMVMLIFVALTAVIGVEAILGAFLAGAMMSMMFRQNVQLDKKLFGIGYGFLIPIFFITVGLTFDFSVFFSAAALIVVPLLFIAGYLSKMAPAMLLLRDQNKEDRLAMGFLLSSHLNMSIGIAVIIADYNSTVSSAIIIMAVVSSVTSPFLFRRYQKKADAAREQTGA